MIITLVMRKDYDPYDADSEYPDCAFEDEQEARDYCDKMNQGKTRGWRSYDIHYDNIELKLKGEE